MDPTDPLNFTNRAVAYWRKGDYDLAAQDFDEALKRNPDFLRALYNRGILRFSRGQFATAASDFAQTVLPDPRNTYPILWLYLALARAEQKSSGEIIRTATGLDLNNWPGPVVSLYRGTINEQTVLAAASSDPQMQCEAYFFVGQFFLLRTREGDAAKMFQDAVSTRATSSVYYLAAKAELERASSLQRPSDRSARDVPQAELIHQVAPKYPKLAKAKHIEGTVVLHAIIAKDGTVYNLEAISGPPELVSAAMDAAKQWVYKPTTHNGEPVEVDTTIEIAFTLSH